MDCAIVYLDAVVLGGHWNCLIPFGYGKILCNPACRERATEFLSLGRKEAEMVQLFGLLIVLCVAALFGAIFRKMGYSPWTGILSVIPFVNLFWWLHLATAEWPIERELARSNDADAPLQTDHLSLMFKRAETCEKRGQYSEALELFQILADELDGKPGSRLAAHCAQRLQQRAASA